MFDQIRKYIGDPHPVSTQKVRVWLMFLLDQIGDDEKPVQMVSEDELFEIRKNADLGQSVGWVCNHINAKFGKSYDVQEMLFIYACNNVDPRHPVHRK